MKESKKIILKGKIFDGISDKLIEDGMVEIVDKKIAYVGQERKTNESMEDISIIEGNTIMPGMIDCHHHFHENGGSDPQKNFIWTSQSSYAIRAAIYAGIELEAGFTTVRDMGAPGFLGVSLRDAINERIVKGPRILTCGQPLTPTAGHGTFFPSWIHSDINMDIFADGVEEVRKSVRYLVSTGVDVIKLLATGGCMDICSGEPGAQTYSYEEIDIAVREAHMKGKKVAVHAQGLSGAIDAIKAGADTIEHGDNLDEEAIQLMIKKNVYLIPTLFCGWNIAEHGVKSGIPEYSIKKIEKNLRKHKENFRNAYKSGVKIAMGSDIGTPFFPHGETAKELEYMVKFGMSNFDALLATTKNASEALGINDKVGTIEIGKMADILVLNKNPLDDISILQKKDCIKAILKEGDIISLR